MKKHFLTFYVTGFLNSFDILRNPRPRPPSNLWKPIVINTNNNSSPAFDSSTSNSEISPESSADIEVQDIVGLETKQEDNNMSPASGMKFTPRNKNH